MADRANGDHPRQTELSTGGLLPRLGERGFVYVLLPISHSICTRMHFASKVKGLGWMFVFAKINIFTVFPSQCYDAVKIYQSKAEQNKMASQLFIVDAVKIKFCSFINSSSFKRNASP